MKGPKKRAFLLLDLLCLKHHHRCHHHLHHHRHGLRVLLSSPPPWPAAAASLHSVSWCCSTELRSHASAAATSADTRVETSACVTPAPSLPSSEPCVPAVYTGEGLHSCEGQTCPSADGLTPAGLPAPAPAPRISAGSFRSLLPLEVHADDGPPSWPSQFRSSAPPPPSPSPPERSAAPPGPSAAWQEEMQRQMDTMWMSFCCHRDRLWLPHDALFILSARLALHTKLQIRSLIVTCANAHGYTGRGRSAFYCKGTDE